MEKIKPRITSAILVEKDGKFLLAERNKENYKGYWIIPGGGVKFGETIQEAAIREIKEETNLDVNIKKLICHKEVINILGKYHSIVFFHLATPKTTEVEAKGDISNAKFFTIDEIKKLKIAESVEWVLKEMNLW